MADRAISSGSTSLVAQISPRVGSKATVFGAARKPGGAASGNSSMRSPSGENTTTAPGGPSLTP